MTITRTPQIFLGEFKSKEVLVNLETKPRYTLNAFKFIDVLTSCFFVEEPGQTGTGGSGG